jgi:hypothetical protein
VSEVHKEEVAMETTEKQTKRSAESDEQQSLVGRTITAVKERDGAIDVTLDDNRTAIFGADMYEAATLRIEVPKFIVTFEGVAAGGVLDELWTRFKSLGYTEVKCGGITELAAPSRKVTVSR